MIFLILPLFMGEDEGELFPVLFMRKSFLSMASYRLTEGSKI